MCLSMTLYYMDAHYGLFMSGKNLMNLGLRGFLEKKWKKVEFFLERVLTLLLGWVYIAPQRGRDAASDSELRS